MIFWSLLLLLATSLPVLAEPKIEDYFSTRDPFKMPPTDQRTPKFISELEKFPTESYRVIGIMTGPSRYRALIQAPDGKTVSVGESNKIGMNKGFVLKIYRDRVLVIEKTTNILGKVENNSIELPLISESEKKVSGL